MIGHYDGLNFTKNIFNGNILISYFNGDNYERIYQKDKNGNITKVIIKYYDKDNNLSYDCEKEKDKEAIYKKDDSINVNTIDKEEYINFIGEFISKNIFKNN